MSGHGLITRFNYFQAGSNAAYEQNWILFCFSSHDLNYGPSINLTGLSQSNNCVLVNFSDPRCTVKVYQWSICNFQKPIDDIKMTFLKSFHKPILQLSKEQFSWIHKIFRRFTAIALRCRFVEKRFKLSDDFVAQRFWRFVEDDVVQRSQIPERSLLIYRRQFEQRRTKLLWKL